MAFGIQKRFGHGTAIGKTAASAAVVQLIANRNVGLFGDSRAFLSHSGGGTMGDGTNHNYNKSYGLAATGQAYSLGAVCIPWALNGGVAGNTTEDMLDRQAAYITTLQAAKCTLVVVVAGTNDRTGSSAPNLDLGTTKKNIREIVRNFKLAGIEVVLLNDTPRGTGSSAYELTAANAADHYAYSRWVLKEMSKMCVVVNTYDAWLDPSSGSLYRPYAWMVRDGIHPSKIGADAIGRVLGPVLARLMRQLGDLFESNVLYNATSNPKGSLTANPLMTETGGTLAASCNASTGSVLAKGWAAEGSNMTGITTTWTKEVDEKGMEWQRVDIKGTAGSTQPTFNLYVNITLTQLADQDKIKATGLFKSRGKGLSNVSLAMLMTPSWTLKIDSDDPDSTLPWPTELIGPCSREIPQLVFTTAAGHTLLRPRFEVTMQPSAAVDATVWFSRCGAMKVAY